MFGRMPDDSSVVFALVNGSVLGLQASSVGRERAAPFSRNHLVHSCTSLRPIRSAWLGDLRLSDDVETSRLTGERQDTR